MKFRPREILFSPTAECNLNCEHCTTPKSKTILSERSAEEFLAGSKKAGIKRIGFTGGEPFLAVDFLCGIVRSAIDKGMLFDNIMTNAVWYKDKTDLIKKLTRLHKAGYDGSICVSVDDFHKQSIGKVAHFIKAAVSIWRRPDVVSIAYTGGSRDKKTAEKLRRLLRLLDNRRAIKIYKIDLTPAGKAAKLKNAWNGAWFKEDFCRGPGNIFFVMPDGSVKPCCGYATDSDKLTIGNIGKDSAADLMKKADRNKFIRTVFRSGLSGIRRRLEAMKYRFPGKTTNHCYFCHYLLNKVPDGILNKCLIGILLILILTVSNDSLCYDGDDKNGVAIRKGLESEEVSPGVNIIKPIGSESQRVNSNLTVLESAEEYAGRKFVDVDERLVKLEKETAKLKAELKNLKEQKK